MYVEVFIFNKKLGFVSCYKGNVLPYRVLDALLKLYSFDRKAVEV